MNIVVTGATKGIGRAIVERFAAEGFNVAFTARTHEDIEQLVNELRDRQTGIEVIGIQADMSKKEEVLHFTQQITKRWQQVDILINNAGIFIPGKLMEDADGVFEQTMHTNLFSAFYTTKELLGLMQPHKHGHIFNICSVASLKAYPSGGAYAVSKFALLGFSRSLREELKEDRIRVTSVMPGATLTASWEGVDLPEDRFMPAEDVATIIYDTWKLSQRTVVEDIVLRPLEGDI